MVANTEVYGKNIVSTEGEEWRYHRKTVAPAFSDKSNHVVWEESLGQADALLKGWLGQERKESLTIKTLGQDTYRLSLHVISKVGFGQKLTWPSTEHGSQAKVTTSEKGPGIKLGRGHKMSYNDALAVPKSILSQSIPANDMN